MPEEARVIAEEVLDVIPLGMRSIARELRRMKHGLALAHFRLLHILAHAPHHLRELAEKRGVSAATMSRSISTLVEKGWVGRTQDPSDRRSVLIELTPAGRQVLGEIQRELGARVADLCAPLSPAEREQLTAALTILRRVFSQLGEGEVGEAAKTSQIQKPQT